MGVLTEEKPNLYDDIGLGQEIVDTILKFQPIPKKEEVSTTTEVENKPEAENKTAEVETGENKTAEATTETGDKTPDVDNKMAEAGDKTAEATSETDEKPEGSKTADATLDTVSDNSNREQVQAELTAGIAPAVEKGSFIVVEATKKEGAEDSIENYEVGLRIVSDLSAAKGLPVIARVSDDVNQDTSQYFLQSSDKSFEENGTSVLKADFDGMWIVSNSDVEKGTCSLAWPKGTIKFDPISKSTSTEKEDTATEDNPPKEPVESVNKTETPKKTKGVSVEEELWDTPVSWELTDIFYAFLSAMYKLGIAAEVNDTEPEPAQYNALIDEMSTLMRQVLGSDADGDIAEDLFKTFLARHSNKNILSKQLKILPATTKMGSRHNKDDVELLHHMHKDLVELEPSVCETEATKSAEAEELETKVADLNTQKTALESELETKKSELAELTSQTTQKSEEVTRLEGEVSTKTKELTQTNREIEIKSAQLEKLNGTPISREKASMAVEEFMGLKKSTSPVDQNRDKFINDLYGV